MNETLKRIKHALGLMEEGEPYGVDKPKEGKIQLAVEATLLDGTKVAADAFEPGNPIFVVAEDGTQSPAPEGVHETEDLKLTVDANGVISAVEPKDSEEGGVEIEIEAKAADMGTGIDQPQVSTDEEFRKSVMTVLESIVTEMGSMKEKMANIESKLPKMEEKMNQFAKAPGAERVKNSTSLQTFGRAEADTFDKKLEILKEIRKGLHK